MTKFKFAIDGKCAVTQLDNGSYSHQGSTAWDIASRDTTSELGYSCNVPLQCKAVNKTYAFTWWQSTEKVEFANGEEDYVVIMCGHDNDINAYVGMKISANVRIGNMGKGGNATGTHVHVEFGKGQYKGTWYANSQGVYVLYNAIDFTEATYMDDLNFQTPTASDVKTRWEDVKAEFKYTTDTAGGEKTTEENTINASTDTEEVVDSTDNETSVETEEVENGDEVIDELIKEVTGDMTISELLNELALAINELENKVATLEQIETELKELQTKIEDLEAKIEKAKEALN